MIIFGKFKVILQLSGLDPEGGRRNIFARIIFSVAFFLFILSTSILLTINFRRDIDQALPILPLFLAFGSTIATYFHLVINREPFYSIFDELQDIVHERAARDEISKIIYARAAQRINSVIKINANGQLTVQFLCLSPFYLVFFHWCLGKYTIDSWFFYYPLWTPFDLNTALRCATIALFESLVEGCIICVCFIVTCYLIGSMMYVQACLLDIRSIFDNRVDPLTKRKATASHMVAYVKQAVELHERVNRYLDQLATVTNMVLFMIVTPYTMCVCVCMTIIAKYSGTEFFYDVQMELIAGAFPLTLLFICFYIGQQIHSNAMGLSDTIYQTEWHRYPSNIRRILQFMILRAQRPFHLSAYGVIEVNLENYVRLLKWLYSAFMLLYRMN